MHPLHFDLIQDEAGFATLEPEWNRLYQASNPRNPFLSFAWVASCWHHLCSGAEPYFLVARQAGRLVGVAPLRRDRELGFRVLRHVGNGWSDYQAFLADRDEPGVEAALLAELDRRRGDWDLAVLRQLTEDYTTLVSADEPCGLRSSRSEGEVSPYFTFPGEWQQLYEQGPGWLKRHAKYHRRFERDGGAVQRLTGRAAAAQMDLVSAIEARSWKLPARVARLQPGPGHQMIREAMERFGDTGELELWLAHIQGEPAGYQIDFVTPQRIWIYQCAFDERFPKSSVGGIIAYLSIQRAWHEGVREYDYLSGNESYKAGRCDQQRSLTYRAFYPNTPRGLSAYGLLVAPRWRLREVTAVRSLWQSVKGMLPGRQTPPVPTVAPQA